MDAVTDAREFKSDVKPIWCPGCGDFGVLAATPRAMQSPVPKAKGAAIQSTSTTPPSGVA